eukprot:375971_1
MDSTSSKQTYHNSVHLKWDVEDEFIENCHNIRTTLMEISIASVYAQIIAEYACTQYIPCVDCGREFGFFECEKDYDIRHGAEAVIDKNDQVRYYLNVGMEAMEEWEQQNDHQTLHFMKSMAVLCVDCGLSYKCAICGLQEQTLSEIIAECIVCKA